MDSQSHTDSGNILANTAQLAKGLSDANRIRILQTLGTGKRSVSALVEELDLSQPLVSHHLRELKRVLLVQVERKGPFVYYRLSDLRILDLLHSLQEMTDSILQNRTQL